jgi:hypothetical protein
VNDIPVSRFAFKWVNLYCYASAMANVMTASFAQANLTHALRRGCVQAEFLSVDHP